MNGYLIPAEPNRIELEVSKSRFIASAYRVSTVDEAKAALARIRAEMPDATHHVYAYRVGYGSSVIEGMSDDGEPSGTSGPPVLAVVRGSQIGDIIVIVTRYFGGTKLGTGGLVRAYGDSAKEVLASLKTELKIERKLVGIDLPYSFYQPVKRLIERYQGTIQDEEFAADVTVIALFPASEVDAFTREVVELTAGGVEPVILSDS